MSVVGRVAMAIAASDEADAGAARRLNSNCSKVAVGVADLRFLLDRIERSRDAHEVGYQEGYSQGEEAARKLLGRDGEPLIASSEAASLIRYMTDFVWNCPTDISFTERVTGNEERIIADFKAGVHPYESAAALVEAEDE